MADLNCLGRALWDVRIAARTEDANMVNNEVSDELFVIQHDDQNLEAVEEFFSWYQSINRLMGNDKSASNILGSLFFMADHYFREGLPVLLIEPVVRRAEIIFFMILNKSKSARTVELQMMISYYILLGLFNDAFRIADSIIIVVDKQFDFGSEEDRRKTLASLEEHLTAPIKSRMRKFEKSMKLLQQFELPDYELPIAENGLEVAWDGYFDFCKEGIPVMPDEN